jgi:hypothetical protein
MRHLQTSIYGYNKDADAQYQAAIVEMDPVDVFYR